MTALMNAVIRINEKERQIKKTRKIQKNSVGVNFSCESFFFLDFSNLKRKEILIFRLIFCLQVVFIFQTTFCF